MRGSGQGVVAGVSQQAQEGSRGLGSLGASADRSHRDESHFKDVLKSKGQGGNRWEPVSNETVLKT